MKVTFRQCAMTCFVLVLVSLLSGCGEPAQELPEVIVVATVPPLPEPVATEAVSSEAVSSEAVNSEEPVVAENGRILTIWADDIRAPALETAAAAFMATHDVTVVVEQLPLATIRQNLLAVGTKPDIFVGSHIWVGELAEQRLLLPIDLGAKSSDFVPVSLAAFTYSGTLMGMPTSTENSAFFMNADLVTQCPATWSDVLAYSRQRVSANNNQYGFVRMEGNAYTFFPLQSAFGGYLFGRDGTQVNTNDMGLDGAGTLAAASFYASLLAEGLQPTGMTMDSERVWFESGQAAMIVTGPWALDSFRAADVHYQICNIPAETAAGQVLVEAQGFMISAETESPQLANTFLTEFVATDETMQAIADADFRLSAYAPVRRSADPDLLAIGEVGATGMPIPSVPEMAVVWEPWETAVTLIAKQQATPEEAFTNAANQIRAAIATEN